MDLMNKDIIHIASFAGNIGDVINHYGFYKSFNIDEKRVEKIEMRRFYKNCIGSEKLAFDDGLIARINSKKLLVLGGGGFFDVYWNESLTGTTLNMSKDFLDKIKIPVLVNAMGVHFIYGREEAQHRFYDFLTSIRRRKNWFITVRNDGSYKRLRNVYGNEILNGIKTVPDNGFLFTSNMKSTFERSYKKRIGLSVTNELLDPIYIGKEGLDKFNDGMKKIINELLEKAEVCFFIHTPQDLLTLYKLFSQIGIEKMRRNVIIAPFSGRGGEILRYYKSCDVIVGMRFHSNVMALTNSIPVIGLAIHEQISDFYEEIKYCKQCVKVGAPDYISTLRDKLEETLSCSDIINEERNIMQDISRRHSSYVFLAKQFLSCNGVIL